MYLYQKDLKLDPNYGSKKKNSDKMLKAQNPDWYYRTFDIEYYQFIQQCENYFATAEVKSHKYIYFAISFLKKRVFT